MGRTGATEQKAALALAMTVYFHPQCVKQGRGKLSFIKNKWAFGLSENQFGVIGNALKIIVALQIKKFASGRRAFSRMDFPTCRAPSTATAGKLSNSSSMYF